MTTAAGGAGARLDLRALALAHIDAENRHDLDAIMDTVGTEAEGLRYHLQSSGETYGTRAEVRDFYARFAAALPDLRLAVRNMVVDEASRQVLVEYHLTGTLRAPFWGLAPTGRGVAMDGVVLYRFDAAGKLVGETSYFDKTELLESMGLLVSTKTALGRLLLIAFQSPAYTLRCVLVDLAARGATWLRAVRAGIT